jgi:hypothetical protein
MGHVFTIESKLTEHFEYEYRLDQHIISVEDKYLCSHESASFNDLSNNV